MALHPTTAPCGLDLVVLIVSILSRNAAAAITNVKERHVNIELCGLLMDPYSRFQSLRTFLVVSGLTLTFAGGRYFRDQLPMTKEAIVEYLIIVIYALVPFVIWAIIVYIILPLVMEKTFFRRLILGRRYIEGTWIQWADEPDSKRGLSILEIQPDRESFAVTGVHFVIAGDHFDEVGKPFNIELIKFEWPTLLYYYFTTPIKRAGESPDAEGVGRLIFTSHGQPPTRFNGTYSYGGLRGKAAVKGRRATTEELGDLHQGDRGRALMRKLIAEFDGRSLRAGQAAPA